MASGESGKHVGGFDEKRSQGRTFINDIMKL
jgi:hypothetical protein